MYDLIDRKSFVRHLKNWQFESFSSVGHEKEYNLLEMIIHGIENERVAYDVEKVVEQLEATSHWEESTYDEDGYSNDDGEEVVYLYRAIEIVEAGGINEKS